MIRPAWAIALGALDPVNPSTGEKNGQKKIFAPRQNLLAFALSVGKMGCCSAGVPADDVRDV